MRAFESAKKILSLYDELNKINELKKIKIIIIKSGANLDQPETLEGEKRTLGDLEEDAGGDDQDSKLPERIVDGESERSEEEADSEDNSESLGENVDSWNDGDSRLLDEDVDPEEYEELKSLEKDAVESEGEKDDTESQPEKIAGALKSSNDGDRDRMSSVKRKLSQVKLN